MSYPIRYALLALLVLSRIVGAAEIDYLRDVQPLLQAHCFSCHGRLEQKSDLRLDRAEDRLVGGVSGPAIVPGDSTSSLLIGRLVDSDESTRMPQGQPALSPDQIELLRSWIDQGAPAPADEELAQAQQHWAFRPLHPPAPPELPSWGRNSIDAFVAAGYAARGVTPRPSADPATLLRRVYLDLIGLPPTRAELHAFVADPSDAAYDQIVDQLLASPSYGERWGRHWMDVWRYSDWAGYRDEIRESQRHIWRWRDWIIESLNADLGYDQMILQMLAADELSPTDDNSLRATGYLARNWYKFNRNVWLDATVEHTTKAFLGLTFNCARCHDHMYDPISQQDYYRLRAFFEPHQVRTDRLPGQSNLLEDGLPRVYDADADATTYLFVRGDEAQPDKEQPLSPGLPSLLCPTPLDIQPVPLPTTAYYPGVKPFVQQETLAACAEQLAQAQSALAAAQESLSSAQQRHAELTSTAGAEVSADQLATSQAAVDLATSALSAAQHHTVAAQSRLAACVARIAADNARITHDPAGAHATQLAAAAGRAEAQANSATAQHAVAAAEHQLATARHALNDQDKQTQQAVTAAETKLADAQKQLEAASATAAQSEPAYTPLDQVYPATSTGRRSALARWIASPDNPLTPRVAVNHIWLRHFGTPLVATVFDFGLHGTEPTHPELLDWLAAQFIASDWSQKTLHRLIVTSATYRLDSSTNDVNASLDPDNLTLWRMPTRRAEAEVVRDSLLHVAGTLDTTMGGPELDENLGQSSSRRSLYFRHANEKQMTFLELFDAPSVNECYQRAQSIAPQQGLALTNSPLALAQARRLARQLTEQPANEPAAAFITAAFETVLTRAPTSEELSLCDQFLLKQEHLLTAAGVLQPFDTGGECEVPPADEPWLRARESLVHVLLSHHDFVTIH